MSREFTGVIEKRGGWYIGYVEELPGVNTQGRTLTEIRENLKEATELIIEANRELMAKRKVDVPVIREKIVIEM